MDATTRDIRSRLRRTKAEGRKPSGNTTRDARSRFRRMGLVFLAACAAPAAAFLYVWISHGSWAAFAAARRGELLVVLEPSKDLGVVHPGDSRGVAFQVSNISGHDVTVIGAQTSCSCMHATDLPVKIPRGEAAELLLTIKVSPAASGGELTETSKLLIDRDAPSPMLVVYGRIEGNR